MSEIMKKCFMDSCFNEPIDFCSCREKPTYTCLNHVLFHCELEGQHLYERIYREIHEETRKAALKHFYKLKSDLKYYKSKIIQTELLLINQIQSVTQKTLQTLKMQDQKLNEYILQIFNTKEIDNSMPKTYIESLLNLSPEDLPKIQTIKSPELFIKSINSYDFENLFLLDEFIEDKIYVEKQWKNTHNLMKFIWSCKSTSISIFDAKNLRVDNVSIETDKNLDQYAPKCLLPDGSLFYDDCKNRKSLLIDQDLNIKILPTHSAESTYASATYFKGEIYLFGGTHNVSIKYSINKNKWKSATSLPIYLGNYAYSAAFKNYIILGSFNSTKVFYYDTLIESLNEISTLNLANKTSKTFFVDNEAVILLELGKNIYKSTDNLMTWNIVGDCSSLPFNAPAICPPITYNKNIYFATYFGIYSFNLMENSIEKIIPLPNKNK